MSLKRARALRRKLTDAELLLWLDIRELKRAGFHFRRQVPIGPYCADFACHSARLIVELDGSQHYDPRHLRHDAKRDAYLESRGYLILRIWNGAVFANPGGVADYVLLKAKERSGIRSKTAPHPKSLRDFDLPAKGRS